MEPIFVSHPATSPSTQISCFRRALIVAAAAVVGIVMREQKPDSPRTWNSPHISR